jgi:hypothetical protein
LRRWLLLAASCRAPWPSADTGAGVPDAESPCLRAPSPGTSSNIPWQLKFYGAQDGCASPLSATACYPRFGRVISSPSRRRRWTRSKPETWCCLRATADSSFIAHCARCNFAPRRACSHEAMPCPKRMRQLPRKSCWGKSSSCNVARVLVFRCRRVPSCADASA